MGCNTLREKQMIFLSNINKEIKDITGNEEANIDFWFEPSFNSYTVLQKEDEEEDIDDPPPTAS